MTTGAGSALTALHYRQQLALKAQAVRDAAKLWPVYRYSDRTSWDRMVALAVPLLQARHGLSAAAGRRYFESMALLETGSRVDAPSVAGLPTGLIIRSLAATGLVGVINGKSKGLSTQAAMQVGFSRFSGGFSRLAVNGGRDAILTAVKSSALASGYERVTSGSPCDFCASLEGEGSAEEAFPAHDHCSCTAQPVFG